MLQTKFSVLYRKLWVHAKFRDNCLDRKTNWKPFCDGPKEGQIRKRTKFSADPYSGLQVLVESKIKSSSGWFASLQNYSVNSWISQSMKTPLRSRRMFTSSPANYKQRGYLCSRRKRSDWIGDEMRGYVQKQAPGSLKSTLEVYEAGKILSKDKNNTDCTKTKEKGGFFKSKKPKVEEGDKGDCCPCECPEEEASTQDCVKEVEPTLPQHGRTQNDECSPGKDRMEASDARNKFSGLNSSSVAQNRKYSIGGTSSNSTAIQAPSNARTAKQSRSCPPPPKRSPANASRARSSAPPQCPPPANTNSAKCPSPQNGPVACRKPCVPCQPPSNPPSTSNPCPPPPVCPQPANPPPKNRCCPPPCPPPPPPPCPPPCPPPQPPPCCAPPSPPKMEALQFDPVAKALNFYMLNAPTSIRKDEVLVQVVYSGVCGTDLMIMEGKFPLAKNTPVILGHEFSGIACAVGSGVSHVKCGDCITVNPYTACHVCRYCARGQYGACLNEGLNNSIGMHKDGGWAEFVVVHKNQVHAIPSSINLGQAVLIQPLSCIVNAMSKLDIPFGSDIVIQGTGVSGCLWASLLHLQGHKNVIACDINEYKRKLFQCLNLNYCILPPEKMCDIKADIVIDCTGSGKSIERGFKILNPQGQLLIFGITPPDEEIMIQPHEISRNEARVLAVVTNTNSYAKAITLAEMMGCRYLDYEKLGLQTFKLGQYEGAMKMKKCGEISKIVFKIQNSK